MSLRIVTPPADNSLPITLAQAKAHLRVDWSDDDDLITGLVRAAMTLVEAQTQRRYFPQTLEWILRRWHDPMRLPVAAQGGSLNMSVNSVVYTNLADGSITTMDPTSYVVSPHGETFEIIRPWGVFWPFLRVRSAEPVVIQFDIGSGVVVPDCVQQAIKLLIGHWYQNTEAVVAASTGPTTVMPLAVQSLLWSEMWS